MKLKEIQNLLKKKSNPKKAKILQRFFKTGKGEYGEGDIFLGISVPNIRKLARKYKYISLKDTESLLHSKIHEERMLALFILEMNYIQNKKQKKSSRQIYNFYIRNAKYINNWDLVDATAHRIIGDYLLDKPRKILYKFAKSNSLWKKRIAIISTFAFIRNNDFKDALKISRILLNDKHDLIHKAVGWMLREIGNRSQKAEESFLKKYCKAMSRTMLRYAIEKFSRDKKRFYIGK